MLGNQHNAPPSKFVLSAEKNQYAIRCYSECGPAFGYYDIIVSNNCNANKDSYIRFGTP
jgi:hypothetical protein